MKKKQISNLHWYGTHTTVIEQFQVQQYIAGAGAGAEIRDKDGAGAENK